MKFRIVKSTSTNASFRRVCEATLKALLIGIRLHILEDLVSAVPNHDEVLSDIEVQNYHLIDDA